MIFGSLFAGIGGFDLGLERAGLQCAWQVEIDPFCRRVLERHWPHVRRHDDVRTFPPEDSNEWRVDLICGGFPCQDVSLAGKGKGLDGDRSGLWFEYARIVRELRPRFVLVENVSGLLVRGFDRVLGSLAEIGYDAEWRCVKTSSIGASQHRERLWILAYPHNEGCQGSIWAGEPYPQGEEWSPSCGEPLRSTCGYWPPGPRAVADIPRMVDGPTNRMDRLRSIGNSVVPQVTEWIGRLIVTSTSHQS